MHFPIAGPRPFRMNYRHRNCREMPVYNKTIVGLYSGNMSFVDLIKNPICTDRPQDVDDRAALIPVQYDHALFQVYWRHFKLYSLDVLCSVC